MELPLGTVGCRKKAGELGDTGFAMELVVGGVFLLKGPLAPPGHPGTQASLGCDLSLAPKVERSLWTWSRSQAGAQGTADGGGGAAENAGHSGKVYAAAAKRACAGRGAGEGDRVRQSGFPSGVRPLVGCRGNDPAQGYCPLRSWPGPSRLGLPCVVLNTKACVL